ncbi:hypothetical protein EDD36DRAFT_44914 [Exophiala viscosa]|uniref:Zn(2)-C6 fungal-type domain-containing protein n=1 Tax=Exophiala viscosa TaxID=2486360 RepID=A0AAN6E7Z0_9EURO|nr:hypothetical protein EDD36DRAFT_44914 [Exophiala viscosa]
MAVHSQTLMRPRRAGHEKSRNGCLTCKIRRVKCDETRPSCRNCTTTGRKCEGPIANQVQFIQGPPLSRASTPVLVPEISPVDAAHPYYERRAFDHFVKHGAPIFAGHVDASFWTDLVPRLAQSSDFVWDAVVSISCLFEHVPYENLVTRYDQNFPYQVTNKHHQQALKYYNRAINSVRRLADRDELDDSVAVLSCILFASVEFQQRNVTTGTELVKDCCRMLRQGMSTGSISKASKANSALHEVVAPFILRKAVLTATLGTFLPPDWNVHHESKSAMGKPLPACPTLNEASIQLYNLLYQCFEVTRVADIVPDLGEDPGKNRFLALRTVLMGRLTQWKSWFMSEQYQEANKEASWMCSYLLMYWAVCYTSLATCVYINQTAFDEHRDQFADIVQHAQVYLAHLAESPTQLPPFQTQAGILPTLYFCALKCRDPILRREALRLMRQAPQQDTLWAFIAPERVVEKVIPLEERGMHSTVMDDVVGLPDKSPPEDRRFAHVSVLSRNAAGGVQRLALQLHRFILQANGRRRLVTEYAWLDQDMSS